MKLAAIFLALVAFANASAELPMGDIKADSELGMRLLSVARRVDQVSAYSSTWVSGYSLKFQGCHHISQWNDEVVSGSLSSETMSHVLTSRRHLTLTHAPHMSFRF